MDNAVWREWRACVPGKKKDLLFSKLVTGNMPLVHKLVKRFMSYSNVVAEREDVVQAGAIGLMRAIEKYDPDRPTKFSTLATHWIRHETQTAMAHMMPMYRPKGSGMPYKEYRMSEDIEGRTGRVATAEELGVTEAQLDKWRSLIYHFVPVDEGRDNDGAVKYREVASDTPPADILMEELEIERKLSAAIRGMSEVERRVVLDGERVMNQAYTDRVRDECLARVKKLFDVT